MKILPGVLAVSLCLLAAGAQGAPVSGGIINLSCMEALAAIEKPELAGVFSFVAEKDSANAFANLVVQKGGSLKKYAAKLEQDSKAAGGITVWDHESVLVVLSLLAGPLADTLEKPSAKVTRQLSELSLVPAVSLETVSAKRKG